MNIFVANISFHTTEEVLFTMFSQYGKVKSARIAIDKATGKSKKFGFVEMVSSTEANEAIKALDNKEIEGRLLRVSMAKEPASGNGQGFMGFHK